MNSRVLINQLGYYAKGAKHAFLLAEADSFDVIDKVNSEIVFSGFPERAIFIDSWGMKISPVDFSPLTLTGGFYITANLPTGQVIRSELFGISNTPYLDLLQSILEAMEASHKHEFDYTEIAFTTACLIFYQLVSIHREIELPIFDITMSINREIKYNLLKTLSRDDFKPSELASVSAAAALGSYYFRKTEKSLSDRLKKVAIKTWIENIELSRVSGDLTGSGTIFWGLCALYAITGAEDFINAAKENIPHDPCSFTVANPSGFGMISAFLLPDGADLALRRMLREALRVKADNLTSNSDIYYVTDSEFLQNSNAKLLSDAITLFSAQTVLREDSYTIAAKRNINYVMGANPLEKCFITGYGKNPVTRPLFPMREPSVLNVQKSGGGALTDDISEEILPGIVVPGANSDIKKDGYLTWQMTAKTPPAKCYGDTKTSPTSNSASLSAGALLFFAAGVE
jgi:hypothetical protein